MANSHSQEPSMREEISAGERDARDGTALVALCAEAVESVRVTGASVTVMAPNGPGSTVRATDAVATRLTELQATLAEGPTHDALERGHPVLVNDTHDARESRWVVFAGEAASLGAGAGFAFPVTVGVSRFGVLTLYRAAAGTLSSDELGGALRLADRISLVLLDRVAALEDSHSHSGSAGWEEYFQSTAYHASGMVMVQLGVPIGEAWARLRAFSYSGGRSVNDVARDIVERSLRIDGASEPEPEDNGR